MGIELILRQAGRGCNAWAYGSRACAASHSLVRHCDHWRSVQEREPGALERLDQRLHVGLNGDTIRFIEVEEADEFELRNARLLTIRPHPHVVARGDSRSAHDEPHRGNLEEAVVGAEDELGTDEPVGRLEVEVVLLPIVAERSPDRLTQLLLR